MDIGARLKEARVAKGISLESLQETTKIQKRYLVAIEEGDFHILPGKFYARAFIKEYANAVGLDSNELIEEHKEEVPKTEEQEETEKIEYSRMERSRRESKGKSTALSTYLPTIATVVVVIGVLFAAWLFFQQVLSGDDAEQEPDTGESGEVIVSQPEDDEAEDAETEDAEKTGETDDAEEIDEEREEETAETVLTMVEAGSGQSPESTFDLTNADDELTILLEADGTTWLDITDESGNAIYSSSFSSEDSPEELDASGKEQLHFSVGNSPALTITINGTEIEYPVSQIHQKLTINVNE